MNSLKKHHPGTFFTYHKYTWGFLGLFLKKFAQCHHQLSCAFFLTIIYTMSKEHINIPIETQNSYIYSYERRFTKFAFKINREH